MQAAPPNLNPDLPPAISDFANWSLGLGIMNFLCAFTTCIPAVVCGHLALARIDRSNGALIGKSRAIGGLALGYLGIPIFQEVVLSRFKISLPVVPIVVLGLMGLAFQLWKGASKRGASALATARTGNTITSHSNPPANAASSHPLRLSTMVGIFLVLVLVGCFIGGFFMFGYPEFQFQRRVALSRKVEADLSAIQDAMTRFQAEHHKSPGDIITLKDLAAYQCNFKSPTGHDYFLPSIGSRPKVPYPVIKALDFRTNLFKGSFECETLGEHIARLAK